MRRAPEFNTNGSCADCGSKYAIYIPPKSNITRIAKDTIVIIPPSGYLYCGVDKRNGKVFSVAFAGGGSASACCSCQVGGPAQGTCGGSCGIEPDGGCFGNCGSDTPDTNCNCKGDTIIQPPALNNNADFLAANHEQPKKIEVQSGGFISISTGIRFASKGDEFLPMIFEAMLKVPYIVNEYNSFLNSIYGGRKVPKMNLITPNKVAAISGFRLGVINVFGRAAIIPIPKKVSTDSCIIGAFTSCNCTPNQGSIASGCELTNNGGCTMGCEGSCCATLTDQQGNMLYSAQAYRS